MKMDRRWLCSVVTIGLAAQTVVAQPAQPWAGAAVSDWANASKAILHSDLSRCEPGSALSDMVLKRGRWKVIPYVMTNGCAGKMVWAPPEAKAPEISFALNAEGWHAVFVGLFSATEVPTTAWIRLDEEAAPVPRFNRREGPKPYSYGHTEEVFLRAVRLQKESRLRFSPQNTGRVSACGLTHVKLIPLAPDEIRRCETEARDGSKRVLAATSDGFSDMFHRSPQTRSALLSAVEVFRDTDFGTLILQAAGGDKANYASAAGKCTLASGPRAGPFSSPTPITGNPHSTERILNGAAKTATARRSRE